MLLSKQASTGRRRNSTGSMQRLEAPQTPIAKLKGSDVLPHRTHATVIMVSEANLGPAPRILWAVVYLDLSTTAEDRHPRCASRARFLIITL